MTDPCPGQEALERLLDDRLGWLEEEELNRHLESCAGCRSWLDERLAGQLPRQLHRESGPSESPGPVPAPLPSEPSLDPRPSTLLRQALTRLHAARQSVLANVFPQIDGYEIEALLGRGASGVVYRARHKRLGRSVAIKLAPEAPELTDPQRQRFRQEAEALAQLRHPNIVQVFDVGDTGTRPWFSMEYVRGVTLARRIDGRPQDPRSATLLVACLARAIACAHAVGIIHRDLKPSNILLEEQPEAAGGQPTPTPPLAEVRTGDLSGPTGGGSGRRLPLTPKIIDFGLVRRLDPADRLTITHEILGTPGYMAPEQARGQGGHLSPATDVYALGAILYELLTGRPPFRRATAMETLIASSFDLPVAPSRLEPGVGRDLETICLKCLEKEPRLRFATAGDLADELERVAGNRPIASRPPGAWGRLYRLCLRNPGPAFLAGLVALLLILGICGAGLFLRNEVRLRREAVLARGQAEVQRTAAIEQRRVADLARQQAESQRSRADENLRLAQSYLARSAAMLAPDANPSEQVTVNEMRLREELESIAAELQADFAERQPGEGELALARAESLRRTVYWQRLRAESGPADLSEQEQVLRQALQLTELPEARSEDPLQADLLRLRIRSDLARTLARPSADEALRIAEESLAETRRLLDQYPGQEELLLLLGDLNQTVLMVPGFTRDESLQKLRAGREELLQRAGNRELTARICERLLLMWRTELTRLQTERDTVAELAVLQDMRQFMQQHSPVIQASRSLRFITLRTHSDLGRALSRQGLWEEAVEVLRESQRPFPKLRVVSEETIHRTLLDHLRLLADALVHSGRYAEATDAYRELVRNAIGDAEAVVARIDRLTPLIRSGELSLALSELTELSAIPHIEGEMALLLAERTVELLEAWDSRSELSPPPVPLGPRLVDLLDRALRGSRKLRERATELLDRPQWVSRVEPGAFQALRQRVLASPAGAPRIRTGDTTPQ